MVKPQQHLTVLGSELSGHYTNWPPEGVKFETLKAKLFSLVVSW